MTIACVTKTDRVRAFLAEGRCHEALRIAKDFRMLGDARLAIQRGWNAHLNPAMYRGMGHDPAALYREGITALRGLYG